MSDFLSNFNGDNYDRRKQEKEPREPKKEAPKKGKQDVSSEKQEKTPEPKLRRRNKTNEATVEIDPSYKKQKRKKRRWVILGAIAAVLALGVFYYQQTHVKVPNFIGKNLSDLQVWASENKIKTEIKESYDLAKEANTILAQEQKSGSRIKKGGILNVTNSLGADPKEKIPLPDFMQMNKQQVEMSMAE